MLTLEGESPGDQAGSFVKDLCLSLWASLSGADTGVLEDPDSNDLIRISAILTSSDLGAQVREAIERKLESSSDWDFGKSKERAGEEKAFGNTAFGGGKNEVALDHYSRAIAWMPTDETKELSILYANRSAALFHLGESGLALQDIDTAFRLGYPAELHYKLHERAGRCYLKDGKTSEASRRFQQALKGLAQPGVNLEPAKLEKIKSGIEKMAMSSSNSGFGFALNGVADASNPTKPPSLPPIVGGRGRPYKNASTKLSVQTNEAEGRHVIATQTIQPGEVILVEKAYVSAMTPEAYHHQCLQCYAMLRAPVPCPACALVSFCSTRCRDLAWASHHKVECGILGILRLAGISITCLMALRVLTQKGLEEVRKWGKEGLLVDSGSSPARSGGYDDYRADHISSLLGLVSHSEGRSPRDRFHRIVMTIFLMEILKRTSFGSAEASDPVRTGPEPDDGGSAEAYSDEILLGTILLRSLQLLQFNAHEIAGWDDVEVKSCFIGGGLFPTLAFFNHSCNPAIVRYFVNDTVVVRTVRTILKGEPVTENYGPIFTQAPKVERQETLRTRYLFDCRCAACEGDWPLFENLSRDHLSFRCTNCRAFLCKTTSESLGLMLRCSRCLKPTNILKSLKTLESSEGKFKTAMELLGQGRGETAAGILLQNLQLFDSILLPPFRDYHWCQEGLRKCYLPMGNKCRAAKVAAGAEQDQQGPIVG